MSIKQTIEQFDPGHFNRRSVVLEKLRIKAKDIGFFPLPLSQNDIDCYWIKLEPNESHKGKNISFQEEFTDDENVIELLKEVARYDGSN